MNPWKIIGWILLAYLVLSLGFCGLAAVNTSSQSGRSGGDSGAAVQQTAQMVSITCYPNYGRPRADLVFINTGAQPISFGKVFVRFGTQVYGSHLNPTSLPPGSRASAMVFAGHGDSSTCSLDALQDRDGNRVNVTGGAL